MTTTRRNENKTTTTPPTPIVSITSSIKRNGSELAVAAGSGSGVTLLSMNTNFQEQPMAVRRQFNLKQTMRPSFSPLFSHDNTSKKTMATKMTTKKSQQCFHYKRGRLLTITTNNNTTNKIISAANLPPPPAITSTTTLTTGISASHLLFMILIIASSSCVLSGQCAPTKMAIAEQQQAPTTSIMEQKANDLDSAAEAAALSSASQDSLVLIELANRPSNQDLLGQDATANTAAVASTEAANNDDAIIVVLTEQSGPSSPPSLRRLIKRSGISDQRLAEIQMMRALKKQFERASKLAASNLNSAVQESAASS